MSARIGDYIVRTARNREHYSLCDNFWSVGFLRTMFDPALREAVGVLRQFLGFLAMGMAEEQHNRAQG